MTITREEDIKKQVLIDTAKKMLIAARTAPKTRGVDNLVMSYAEGNDIKAISSRMKQIWKKTNVDIFLRDADNILCSSVIVLIGTSIHSLGLKKCGMCGFKNCDEKDKHKRTPCAFNTLDLGIAMGSAVSVAMDNRVDNRIMYTVGQAVIDLKMLGSDVKIAYGIPLSATSKNPFFDRK